jgi:hypothetical protein
MFTDRYMCSQLIDQLYSFYRGESHLLRVVNLTRSDSTGNLAACDLNHTNLQGRSCSISALCIHLLRQYRWSLEYSIKAHQMTGREYTTVGALKYRPSLHLPVSTNKNLLTTSLSKRGASDHSSNGGTLNPSNRSSAMDNCYPPEIQAMSVNLTVSTSECAPPALTFPLSRESSISMHLCGKVVTYDLKSLGLNPQVIIELLKATKSECATWMIVSAFYRRRGEPRNGISVMKSFLEGELIFCYTCVKDFCSERS